MRLKKLALKHDPNLHQAMRLVFLTVLSGVLIAIAVQVFRYLIDAAEQYFLFGLAGYLPPNEQGRPEQFGSFGRWLLPISTTLGGLISGILVFGLAKETSGGGENAVISAFHNQGGSVRRRVAIVKALTSAITIGSGGAAGREGPMAQISASLSCFVAKLFNLALVERRMLMVAGTAAGISAIFSSPLGAAFLAVEILYSKLDLEVEALMYAIIAAAVAYACNGFFVGWESVYDIPPELAFTDASQLFWFALLGIAAGGLSIALPHIYYTVEHFFSELNIPVYLKPALGGLAVGLIGLACPAVLGSGYGWMELAMHGDLAIGAMLVLAVLKIFAFSLTIGSGGSGGVFAPVMFSGAMLGAAASLILAEWVPNAPDCATMSIVGMAAFFAGVGRAPVATMVMATELTGGHSIIVPTMIAVAFSYIVQSIFSAWFPTIAQTLYSAQVPTRGDSPTHQQEYVQIALELVQRGGVNLNGPLSIPDFHKFLDLGQPIPVGDNGEFLFSALVPQTSSVCGLMIRDLDFVDKVLIVGISRGPEEREITPSWGHDPRS